MKKVICGWAVRAVLMSAIVGVAEGRVKGQHVSKADPAPASMPVAWDDAEKAVGRFKYDKKQLKVDVWAAEPQLSNPVQMTTDEKGRIWIAETFRYRLGGVVDVRNINWLDADLATRTVDERIANIKKQMGDRAVPEMTMNTERLQMVQDTDNDGRADYATTFAAGFNAIPDGIASGVAVRGNKVWFANIPHLWLLENKDGKEASRKSLHYGYGVHYSLEGHDLHGLKFGPDGRLYFTIGDRGLHIETEGKVLDNADSGCTLRCNPDGSKLEIFATGERNPQDLVFDEYGNLFSGDNNADYGDQGKWIYIVEGGDSGWRMGYQHMHRPAPGGPWMMERIWGLEEESYAAYRVPPVAHISSGPSGVTYQPTGATGEKYRGKFFLCDFRGGRTNSGVWTFSLKPKGATFELVDRQQFIWQVLATDIETGTDGSLYISDWTDGWQKPGKGRIERVYDPTRINDPILAETKKLIADGMENRSLEEVAGYMGYPDPRVRQAAQFEMVRRGGAAIPMLYGIAQSGGTEFARIHGIWGVWQLAIKDPKAAIPLIGLLRDPNPEIRAQVARVLGDVHCVPAYDGLVSALEDSSPRVQFFAAMGLGHVGKPEAVAPLLAMLAKAEDKDPYLRHAGGMGLAGCGDVKALVAASKNPSVGARVGALLGLRHMKQWEVATYLHDSDPRLVLEAARAIMEVPIEGAWPQLAGMADGKSKYADAVWYRILDANVRLGTPEGAKALATIAARSDVQEKIRYEALTLLGEWEKPSQREYVLGLWRPLADRDVMPAKSAVREVLDGLLHAGTPDTVRIETIKLTKALGLDDEKTMDALVHDDSAAPGVRAAALEVLASYSGQRSADAIQYGLDHGKGEFRQTAIKMLVKLPDAVAKLEQTLKTSSVPDQQMVLQTLAGVEGPAVEQIESTWMDNLIAGKVAPELQLDLLETANKSKADEIKAKVKKYLDAKPKDDPMADYHESLAGGNADAGKRIFIERQDVSCIRCHKAGGDGGTVGPELAGIGTRHDRNYIMESILLPNKQIAPGFDGVAVRLNNGTLYNGVVKSETDTELTIDVPDKGLVKLAKADIKGRSKGQSPMPEGLGKALSKQDMRNLVEFLASLKQPGDTAQAAAGGK